MHPETAITIAVQRTEELCAEARSARLARQDRAARAVASLPLPSSCTGAGFSKQNGRWRQLFRRRVPGRPQPA
jgi:hypothetical protein